MLCAPGVRAQQADSDPWSLEECINYAIENNITVRQRALQVEKQEEDLSATRYSRLPDLNATIGGSFSNSRADYYNDNPAELSSVYDRRSVFGGSLSVTASIPVFQAMKISKQIKGSKLDLAAAVQDLDRIKEDVSINIMTLYLDVLYTKEMVGVAERQLELSTLQAVRSREMVNAGKQPQSARYESEALQANDALALTKARNDLQLALLNLSQALNRESAAGFEIEEPVLDQMTLASLHMHGSVDAVYDYAADNRPNIKAERLRLESSENSVLIAKTALYPSISLSGRYGTSVNDQGSENFGTQFRRNRNPYIGATMNIPIFNRRATRKDINLAKIAVRSQQLAVTEAEQSLRKEIEQAWYNADAAYSKYRSADAAFESAKVAFSYEEHKAEAGRSTTFDFNDAKTRMEKAESELVQSKYEFIFRSKILDFYRGTPLRL